MNSDVCLCRKKIIVKTIYLVNVGSSSQSAGLIMHNVVQV